MLLRAAKRLGAWVSVSRLVFTQGSGAALHHCELLAAARFAGIPAVNLREILGELAQGHDRDDLRVVMHPLLTSSGSGSIGEMAALSAIVAARRPRRVLEFGTYDGCSTWHIWANSPEAQVTTLDLPGGTAVQGSTDAGLQGVAHRPFLPADARVKLIEIDSRQWTPSDADKGVDLCFIDAGHSYECVENDTRKALPLMNTGGVILWHDSVWRRDGYGVNAYLKDLRRSGRDVRLLAIGAFDYCGLSLLVL